jgi:hypothetical protein
MTQLNMHIDGADTVSNNLSRARTEIPDELAVAGSQGITLIHRAAGSYPSYAGKGKSERTGLYGKTQTSGVYRQGSGIVAYHNSPAKHSIWVRGDGLKYPGAWMHVGVWQSLISILAENLPKIRTIVDAALQRVMNRLLG